MLNLEAAAALVVANYDVGGVKAVKEIRNGPGSLAWRIEAGDADYCLKHHRHGGLERVHAELTALKLVQEAGFKTFPEIRVSTAGDTIVLSAGGVFSLTKWIEADVPFNWTSGGWSVAQAGAAGAELGEFHVAGSCVELDAATTKELKELPGPELIDWGYSVMRSSARFLPDGITLALANFEDLVRSAMVVMTRDGAMRGLIHGDFHPGNLLYRGDRIVAVLDSDYFRVDSRLFDVAYACTTFALDDLDHRKSHALLARYNETVLSSSTLRAQGEIEWTQLLPAVRLSAWSIAMWLVFESRHEERKLRAFMPVIERCIAILSATLD